MISLKYFLIKVRDVKLMDVLSIFPMILAFILSPFFKRKYKNTWLITEEKYEARDNGYWFFKNITEKHPEQKCIYAIEKKSVDYENVKALGKVIQFGSLFHWILYFTCQYNISSQKGGKPNAALCAFIELNNFYDAHNIFLQHGVTKDNAEWLHADRCRFQLFITTAKPEQDYIVEKYGYRDGVVKLLGFPRFDNLHNFSSNENQIIIMPTWRNWLKLKSKQLSGFETDFYNSEYMREWIDFLESKELNRLIETKNLKVIFYPHRNVQNFFLRTYSTIKTKVVLADWKKYNLQDLLKQSKMMITDYSSVFFDMVYMKKPVVFYQFDYKKYRQSQYQEGYFDYKQNDFGKSYETKIETIEAVNKIIESNYEVSEAFNKAHDEYFPFYDTNNSERIFLELSGVKNV